MLPLTPTRVPPNKTYQTNLLVFLKRTKQEVSQTQPHPVELLILQLKKD